MFELLLWIGVMFAGLFLISRFVRWYTDFCYRHLVNDKDEQLDRILDPQVFESNLWASS